MIHLINLAVIRLKQSKNQYHNLEHTVNVVHSLYQLNSSPSTEQLLAAWYHDSVYVPGSTTNEQDSCDLFMKQSGNNFPDVCKLIMSTTIANHLADDIFDIAHAELMDADLSSFAHDTDAYISNSINLIKENSSTPLPIILENRKKFLCTLIGKGYVFRTERGKYLYEKRSLENINADISGKFDHIYSSLVC